MKKMVFTNNWFYHYVLLIVLLVSGFARVGYAASVPNVFTSGTVAKSSEVNANFNYLADRAWELSDTDNEISYNKGNVGIGTTNPTSKLEVVALNQNEFRITTENTRLSIYEDIETPNWIRFRPRIGNGFLFSNNGDDPVLAISENRKVGIGTTSPEVNLDILDTASGAYLRLKGAGDSYNFAGISLESDEATDNIWSISHRSASQIYKLGFQYFNGAQWQPLAMVMQPNGNVGIGTTEPDERLHIKGTDTWGTAVKVTDTTNNVEIAMRAMGEYELGAIGTSSNHDFHLSTNGIAKMVIKTDGNVGIGTESPEGKLDVNGSIYQRGSNLHADYVFEKEYTLESIEEHSKYMWKNKHLKAIPKAKVDQSGQEIVEVGAHRKGIVEELEKAHIYIEQLHKRINEMEGLKAKNEALELLGSKLLIRIEALENNK